MEEEGVKVAAPAKDSLHGRAAGVNGDEEAAGGGGGGGAREGYLGFKVLGSAYWVVQKGSGEDILDTKSPGGCHSW